MAYIDIADMSGDTFLMQRVTACAAEQDVPDPQGWAYLHRWEWAASPGWADAFGYAKAGGNPNPGRDPAVITDGMILAEVQSLLAGATPTPT